MNLKTQRQDSFTQQNFIHACTFAPRAELFREMQFDHRALPDEQYFHVMNGLEEEARFLHGSDAANDILHFGRVMLLQFQGKSCLRYHGAHIADKQTSYSDGG